MIKRKLSEIGLTLPPPAEPTFQYVPVTVHAGVAYVSGQLPKEDGEVRITGKVGDGVDVETAQRAARICILQGLSCLEAAIGSLDDVERILKVTGFVASSPGFNEQPRVIDAASSLLAGALKQARHVATGLEVDAGRMRANLEMTNGLVMSEAVMMGLGPYLGREYAHDLVYDICREAIRQNRPLLDLLAETPEIARHLKREQLAELCDPANYLGQSGVMVDRVLGRLRLQG